SDDRQPEDPPLGHRRSDRLRDLRDLAVGLAHRDGPVRGAAHHHTLQDSLAADRGTHRGCELLPTSGGRRRRARAYAGSARRGRRYRPASASPCRRGGRPSRSRRGAPASSNASGTRFRRSSKRLRGHNRDEFQLSLPPRIPEAIFGSTLPPETTMTTADPGVIAILRASRAAVAAAPAGSQASFARAYRKRIAASISSSETSTTSSTR